MSDEDFLDLADFNGGLDFREWAPLVGSWQTTGSAARYVPPDESDPALGILLAPDHLSLQSGMLNTTVRFEESEDEKEPQARIVFGFNPGTEDHYSAGLGGYRSLYSIETFLPREGYRAIYTTGSPENLRRNVDYELSVFLHGQSMLLDVNGVSIKSPILPGPLNGTQVGITARGRSEIEFTSFDTSPSAPQAFVVMQFGEPFDTLYRDVIKPVCEEMGYSTVRADEFNGPGVIMADIVRGIREASVVIAEITPANPNVFYELGYAQATEKPTILLAERAQDLPFDISGQRCIFYDDTIGGKSDIEATLRRHLSHIVPPGF